MNQLHLKVYMCAGKSVFCEELRRMSIRTLPSTQPPEPVEDALDELNPIITKLEEGYVQLDVGTDRKVFVKKLTKEEIHVNSMACTSDGTILACGGDNGQVELWDVSGTEPKFKASVGKRSDEKVNSVALNSNGTLAFACGWTAHLYSFDKFLQTYTHVDEVTCVAFSPNGDILAISDGGGHIRVINMVGFGVDSYGNSFVLKAHHAAANSLTFSHDGKILASVSSRDENNLASVKLWDAYEVRSQIKTKLFLRKPQAPKATLIHDSGSDIHCVAFSPYGETLAYTWTEGMTLCDLKNFKLRSEGQEGIEQAKIEQKHFKGEWSFVGSMAFSPNSGLLALGTNGGAVKVLDVMTDNITEKATIPTAETVRVIKFLPTIITVGSASQSTWEFSKFKNSDPIQLKEKLLKSGWGSHLNRLGDILNYVVGVDPDLYYTSW